MWNPLSSFCRPQGRDIPCSQRNQNVARSKLGFQSPDNFRRSVARQHGGTQIPGPPGEIGRRDLPRPGTPLARAKDLGHQYPVGILQAGGQFVQ
jgi:hypothetical protein